MQVTIKVDKPEISDIIATFQRYDYNVKVLPWRERSMRMNFGSNYDNLMNLSENLRPLIRNKPLTFYYR
jgi:hypothetical protein